MTRSKIKRATLVLSLCLLFISCQNDDDNNIVLEAQASFIFSHYWDNDPITNANFNTIQYTNTNGEQLSIEKLRYIISDITFYYENGDKYVVEGYNLVDVTNNDGLTYAPDLKIPRGNYTNVSFTFGLDNEDNYYEGGYNDLNSVSWNVPDMLGGGYHFMQLEGKFIDNTVTETGYQYHAIRAVDNSGSSLVFADSFFEVNLGAVTVNNDITINIAMNIAEWFKNPNTWDLNALHAMLMSNYDAQIMMYQNGQHVFSLEGVTEN